MNRPESWGWRENLCVAAGALLGVAIGVACCLWFAS
jgi:hypothetical protein